MLTGVSYKRSFTYTASRPRVHHSEWTRVGQVTWQNFGTPSNSALQFKQRN